MNLGQVYTKQTIADFMARLFTITGKARVLDPCFGRGVFVKSLLDNSEFIIDGVEIDETSFAAFSNPDERRCHLMNCDFFDVERVYDGIIMNPPYVRQEELDKLAPLGVTKQKLQSACWIMNISSKANLYMYFILRAILLLRKGGELIAIFPNSWTNTPVGRQFYEQMKLHGCITDFINVEGDAFEGSPMVDVCILKYVKGKLGETHYQTMRITQDDSLLIEDAKHLKNKMAGNLVKLRSVASIRRGITTGANKFFVNPPLFTQIHMVNILSSPKDFTGYTTKHCQQDKLLAIKSGDNLNEEEETYLENSANAIREEGKPSTLKLLIDEGRPWYYITVPDTAQIVFSYIVRNNLKFVLNEGKCNVRDNFYMISSRYDSLMLMALLNNYYVYRQLEDLGKSYGKGLLKLQKYDIDEIKVPHPKTIQEKDKVKLVQLTEKLVKSSDECHIDAITNLLMPYYGYNGVKEEYIELKSKRLAHHE
ncbi:MAG: Eco57I restriction-modification methylase domain-containing protein [Bacteroidaceae bacterium]|nr:Eco57I restriction-modification methylase domain-containing protein [Bacteroidaceae bacterium]